MLCSPTESVEVVKLASMVVPSSGSRAMPAANEVLPSKKLTVPVRFPEALSARTVAVNVTLWPKVEGVWLEASDTLTWVLLWPSQASNLPEAI